MTDQEINEAVAQKLGWHQTDVFVSGGGTVARWSAALPDGRVQEKLPDYCHDIKAAWEIVDYINSLPTRIGDKGHFYFQMRRDKQGYTVKLIPGEFNKGSTIEATASIAPLAICLAFLKLQ